MIFFNNFVHSRDPSIKGNTPFKSCRSGETFCQEFSKEPPTNTTFDIKNQLHYSAWREIEKIYDNLEVRREIEERK